VTESVVVSEVVDASPIGLSQWGVFLLCFIIAIMDGFDTQAIAFTGPAIAVELALSTAQMAPILSAGVVGMALGALLLGPLGDRAGRRPAVLLCVLLFALFSLATAYASTVWQLVLFRLLAGLGMGGVMPNLLAVSSEHAPARRRSVVVSLVLLGLPVGGIIGALLGRWLLPVTGWQTLFLIGGAVPLLAWPLLYWLFPESLAYLVVKGGQGRQLARRLSRIAGRSLGEELEFRLLEHSGTRTPVRALLAPGLVRTTVGIWVVYFCNWVAWYMLVLWLPTVLVESGLELALATRGTLIINISAMLAVLPIAAVLGRISVRWVLVVMLVGGFFSSIVLADIGTNWWQVYALLAVLGVLVGAPQVGLNYLALEVYPTAARSSGVGWAIGMGRLGTVVGSLLGGWVIAVWGVPGFYLALALPLLLAGLVAVGLRPPTTG